MADDFDPGAFVQEHGDPADFDPSAFVTEHGEPTKKPTDIGSGATGALHATRHLAFGLGDKITAGIHALYDTAHNNARPFTMAELADAYRRDLAYNDKALDESDKLHPAARWTGNALGVAGSMAVPVGVGRLGFGAPGLTAQAPSLFQLATQGAKTGAALGALGGFGSSRADSFGQEALDVGKGAAVGSAVGFAAPYVAAPLVSLGRRVVNAIRPGETPPPETPDVPLFTRGLKPNEDAQVLLRNQVPLTLGQMQPGGVFSEAEEAAGRLPILGKAVEAQRENAVGSWRDALLNETRPIPGALRPGSVDEKLKSIYDDFGTAYDEIRAHQVQALGATEPGALAPLDKAMAWAADHKEVYANPSEREAAAGWLANQAAPHQLGLQGVQPGETPPLVEAGAILKMRHNIRTQIRAAARAGDEAKEAILKKAEQSLTSGLEQQLPEAAVKALRKTDAQYAKYKVLEDAVFKAGDREGSFTPAQMSQALKNASDKGDYARGGGGPLRELVGAGYRAFMPKAPKTGFGELAHAPFAYGFGPLVYRANQSPELQDSFIRAALDGGLEEAAPQAGGAYTRGLSAIFRRAGVRDDPSSP